nr:MAG TPA: hypothetical protein [Bacteriophage sp.]
MSTRIDWDEIKQGLERTIGRDVSTQKPAEIVVWVTIPGAGYKGDEIRENPRAGDILKTAALRVVNGFKEKGYTDIEYITSADDPDETDVVGGDSVAIYIKSTRADVPALMDVARKVVDKVNTETRAYGVGALLRQVNAIPGVVDESCELVYRVTDMNYIRLANPHDHELIGHASHNALTARIKAVLAGVLAAPAGTSLVTPVAHGGPDDKLVLCLKFVDFNATVAGVVATISVIAARLATEPYKYARTATNYTDGHLNVNIVGLIDVGADFTPVIDSIESIINESSMASVILNDRDEETAFDSYGVATHTVHINIGFV